MKTYSVEEVLAAECTLEPMECKYCGSLEVVFLQYVGDAYCEDCGTWQLDRETGRMMKFSLGQVVVTAGVNDKMADDAKFAVFVKQSMNRHAAGDWGNLCADDVKENEYALSRQLRLLSAYEQEGLPKIWIITEADRSATTVLFPDEY